MSNETAITLTNYDKLKIMATNQENVKKFMAVLGNNQIALSYIHSAMIAVANSDDLQKCAPGSIMSSALRAATLKLSCDPILGHAWLIPRYSKKLKAMACTFQPGYKGYQFMAQRTNKYRVLNDGKLFEGEYIEQDKLTGSTKLCGKPISKTVIGYFHYFQLYNGLSHFLYMTVEELQEHADRYAPDNPKWHDDFDAMARKTVVRLNLSRHGYLDPNDQAGLQEVEAENTGYALDENWSEEDTREVKAPRSISENLSALGFDDTPPAPMDRAEPETVIEAETKPVQAETTPADEGNKQPAETPADIELIMRREYEGKKLGAMTAGQLMDLLTDLNDRKAAGERINPLLIKDVNTLIDHMQKEPA